MKCQRDKFILQRKYAYLNCAYMSPMLKKVENAGKKGIARKRRPHKISSEDFFKDGETARVLFSKVIGSESPRRCVVIPSVSYGLANVARNLNKKKGQVILADEQFPSNVYPWMNLGYDTKLVKGESTGNRGQLWNEKILDSIDKETAAVSIGNVHWADGTLFDLQAIRERCDQFDAQLIIDGTQSIGALPFNTEVLRPDAVICASYKWLMGPYGIGMAYYGERFDEGQPIEENWINRLDSEDFAGLVNYQSKYHGGALRYEVGEHSNFILLPMMIQAFKQILKWQPSKIQEYCHELMKDAIAELLSLGYQVQDADYRAEHLIGLRLPKSLSVEKLQQQFRIHKTSVSVRGDAIRVAPNVYNDSRDVNKFLKAVKSAL
ncbi:MAG: aminotransferase class V-fold PLP-dependent enzyme [Cyclobacteriaceae bacterium]|nr:aminotransferase class V-fold PLP-dependent enzyme [Cyclobacteriaceae bacterium HetDA_MAG_MS6]